MYTFLSLEIFHSLHLVCFFLSDTRALYESPAGKTVPKMNNQSLKNACFQSPAYFQKSKLYFSKSKPYFFESKVSFFPAPFIPKMNSAIIRAPFGHNPVLRFRVFRHSPPFKPLPSGRKACFSKKHGTHIMCAYACARDEPPRDPP